MEETIKNEKREWIPFCAPWATISNKEAYYPEMLDGKCITFKCKKAEEYTNHIEMSGFYCSAIISYGNDSENKLRIMRHAIYPNLRIYPNDTYGSLDCNFTGISVKINGKDAVEKAVSYALDGFLHIVSDFDGAEIERTIFAAPDAPAIIEKIRVKVKDDNTKVEFINNDPEFVTEKKHGYELKQYRLFCTLDNEATIASPDNCANANVCYVGCGIDDCIKPDPAAEYNKRLEYIDELDNTFIVETPDREINSMARFSKLRVSESIYKTKAGLMHSPGGGRYYAALWTNDQCEYANPLFGYLGYETGEKQAVNSYDMYKQYISDDRALISSIISAGDGIWYAVGDRGDSAMYAYGCSRFLLSAGDKELALKFIKKIDDCLTFTLSQITPDGVVASDTDELETRFLCGNANLSTSCLAYDALLSAAYIHDDLGSTEKAEFYRSKAADLAVSIESYFGANVEGYDTYRYCAEEPNLRSWICLPLVVGIKGREDATAATLTSDRLLIGSGLLTRSGEKTYWDRSLLYALRGLFVCGKADCGGELLQKYTKCRHLGNHPPYAIEAYPEGNQMQLAAESGLYVRIFAEGIFGYRPTGFDSFALAPNLPHDWDKMTIRNFKAGKKNINIEVKRSSDAYDITISGDVAAEYIGVKNAAVVL